MALSCKIIFLIFTSSIIGCITCKAQLNHTSDFVELNLPNNTYRLSKVQVDALPGNKPATAMEERIKPKDLYNIDNVILSLHDVNQGAIVNNMDGNKRFLDELYSSMKNHGNNSYQSIVKNTPNSNHTLIISYIIKDVGHYRFYCQNAANALTLSGKLDFKKSDSAKASAVLDDILKNIQFTK